VERSDEGSRDRQIAIEMDTREDKEDIVSNVMAGAAPLVPCQSFACSSCSIHPALASLGGLLWQSSFRKGQ
jgi:hypothetical protein